LIANKTIVHYETKSYDLPGIPATAFIFDLREVLIPVHKIKGKLFTPIVAMPEIGKLS